MATVAVPRSERRFDLRASDGVLAAITLIALVALSIYVRTRAISGSFWMDEGLSVGISSHDLLDIPGVLREDGSPPLYYMGLHVWMDVFGRTETAVHWFSLTASLLTIPSAMWAGWSLWGKRAGFIGAALCTLSPFLTSYGEEARMYALMTLWALLATAFFLHAFVYRRGRLYIAGFALFQTLMLYTHGWGIFYGIGAFLALILIWSRSEERRALAIDGLAAFCAAAILFLPWLPTLLFQTAHTAAPWGRAPRFGAPIQISRDLLGGDRSSIILLLIGGFGLATALQAHRGRRDGERLSIYVLVLMPVVTLAIAWTLSQITPAWASRYFAVALGPILLLAALGLARAKTLGICALAVLMLFWLNPKPFVDGYKSDVRDIGAEAGSLMRPNDMVIVGQPEQVPVAWYYMPGGLRYADTAGPVADPRHMDWIDAMDKYEAAQPREVVPRLLDSLQPGQKVLFMRPLTEGVENWSAPWTQLARRRSAQFGAILAQAVRDGELRELAVAPKFYRGASTVGNVGILYEKVSDRPMTQLP
ncbi:glycosyltransferase family 39 protein [Conexibacter sp. CPCC 206217]|uniref:glycosyltransferase family 39 protein n=1 Tax=Conexibacter sp. CPCC 206217 TaxID=3064574 RepID=UPI00271F180D|nr:glycosyltransferase family 39 protein [Conexibacter sp. CPCC 206217]MDO8211814.1 glycosyltransferase family 39 protein [Conexibacter sp. CPCC 206217]